MLACLFVADQLFNDVAASDPRPCIQRRYAPSSSVVCVCNSTYCDDFPPVGEEVEDPEKAVLYVSSLSGKYFDRQVLKVARPHSIRHRRHQTSTNITSDTSTRIEVSINPNRHYQLALGFGGAFTDSVGINLNALSSAARANLLHSYFGSTGIEYTTGRVPMASTDFSTRIYSYDDHVRDMQLENFSLPEEDLTLKIPYIKHAIELSGSRGLKLFATPWSAPGWMKDTDRMQGSGKLKGSFNGPYYKTWALYFIKWVVVRVVCVG